MPLKLLRQIISFSDDLVLADRRGFFVDKEISSLKRWRQVQVVTNHLWGRWLRECLPAVVQRAKWTQDVPNLKVADMVIIVD